MCDYLSYVAFYYCQICIRLDGPRSLVVSLVSLSRLASLSLSFPNGCLFRTVTGKGEGEGAGGVAAIADCIGLTNCATDMAIYAAIAL